MIHKRGPIKIYTLNQILLIFYIYVKPFLRTFILSRNILITKKLLIRILNVDHQHLKKNHLLTNIQ